MDRRFYLVAYLTPEVSGYIDAAHDLAMTRTIGTPVAAARRHLTILNLAVVSMPEALLAAALHMVMTVAPPAAFRVVLDTLVARADRALIGASEPVAGFRRCQSDVLAGLRRYAIDLPRHHAAVRPHVTLGYDCAAAPGAREIDGLSWRVDAVALIASHHGKGHHELIEQWRLYPPPMS